MPNDPVDEIRDLIHEGGPDVLSKIADVLGAQAVPTSEQAGAPTDEDEALDLLEVLFDAWEDGTPCYEDPDTQGAFLGQAFRLDGATFYRCANILNRRRSRDATVPASGGAAPVTNIAPSDMVEVCREDANNYCRILRVLGMEDEGDAAAEVKRLHAAQATPGLSEQDAGLLEQGALMLEALSGDERNRGNDSAAMGADCSAHAVRRLAAKLLAAPVAEGDAREEASIGKAMNRAARDLPEDWEIRIDLERHAGTVHLIDPEGCETMIEAGGEPFSAQISAAIDAARAQAASGQPPA